MTAAGIRKTSSRCGPGSDSQPEDRTGRKRQQTGRPDRPEDLQPEEADRPEDLQPGRQDRTKNRRTCSGSGRKRLQPTEDAAGLDDLQPTEDGAGLEDLQRPEDAAGRRKPTEADAAGEALE